MSTRCQVKVIDNYGEKLTLYHHCDGYPSHMIGTFRSAYGDIVTGESRVGKVASYLCAVEPGEYEPLDNHDLHSDIEWYYVINCSNKHKWIVDIYKMSWKRGTIEGHTPIWSGDIFTLNLEKEDWWH